MLRKSLGTIAFAMALCMTKASPARSQALVETTVTYVVDADSSKFTVKVGRAGFFKVFGHDHTIAVERYSGSIEWNEEDPTQSRFVLDVEAASLLVSDEELSDKDRASVQAEMEFKALALPEYPRIRFESSEIRVKSDGEPVKIEVTGVLDLRGVQREIRIPMELRLSDSVATVSGEFEINGKDFGVPQISVAGGAVKTKNELEFVFALEMQAAAEPAP